MKKTVKMKKLVLITIALFGLLISCNNESKSPEESSDANNQSLTGNIRIDGSSTVYPITEAIAEEYRAVQPKVKVTVGISGTGGGFKKFSRGETDISDASRPIKQKEIDACIEQGIKYLELSVAYDGLAVLINPQNDWVDHFTVEELKNLWHATRHPRIPRTTSLC